MLSRIQKRNFLTIINQGTQGLRLSFGRDPVILNPGIHLNIPIYHTLEKVDIRECAIPITKLQCFTSDNVPVNMDGSLFYQVVDAHKACFNVSKYINRTKDIGTSAMRSVIGTFEYDTITADRNQMNQRLKDTIGVSISEWGIICTRFEIQSFEPSNNDVRKQLEKQMEAERERRKQLLDTEANVTVSDGLRRKTILEADGEFYRIKREAESHKITLTLEAEGLKEQLAQIAQTLDGNKDLAVQVLLEIKRLEQLKAIASGTNNSVYFTHEKSVTDSYIIDLVEKLKK